MARGRVTFRNDPAPVRVLEIYTDDNAYKAHLETPHFQKFGAATENIVKSRKLLDAVPTFLVRSEVSAARV